MSESAVALNNESSGLKVSEFSFALVVVKKSVIALYLAAFWVICVTQIHNKSHMT